jgi:hypothetical protein
MMGAKRALMEFTPAQDLKLPWRRRVGAHTRWGAHRRKRLEAVEQSSVSGSGCRQPSTMHHLEALLAWGGRRTTAGLDVAAGGPS